MFKFDIIKKADIILVVMLIMIGLAASVFLSSSGISGQLVVITIDGKEYGSYTLLEDTTISIDENGAENTIVIKKGAVSMSHANCEGRDCIKQGRISQTSQAIICLPHKLIVEIKGGKDEYDSISK